MLAPSPKSALLNFDAFLSLLPLLLVVGDDDGGEMMTTFVER